MSSLSTVFLLFSLVNSGPPMLPGFPTPAPRNPDQMFLLGLFFVVIGFFFFIRFFIDRPWSFFGVVFLLEPWFVFSLQDKLIIFLWRAVHTGWLQRYFTLQLEITLLAASTLPYFFSFLFWLWLLLCRSCRLHWVKMPTLTLHWPLTYGVWAVPLLKCWMENLLGVILQGWGHY